MNEINSVLFPRRTGIYCFENMINQKKYVGKAVNLYKRIKEHLVQLNNGTDECSYFQNAWNKYQGENFICYIVEFCLAEKANELEQYYIKEWNTKRPNGYNLTDGGGGMLGYIPGDETRKKLSIAMLGRYVSEETRRLHSEYMSGKNNPLRGKPVSEETREKQRQKRLGAKASFETKQRMSKVQSKENNPMWGKHLSDSTKKLLSDALSGENNPMFGIHPSDEQKRAQSIRVSGENNPNYGKLEINNPKFAKKIKGASSLYFGVYKINRKNKCWIAQIRNNRKYIRLGYYKTEIEAVLAYNNYIRENNLINYPLNLLD